MTSTPKVDLQQLHAGMRVAVAVSGGADSVGLLRALIDFAPKIGLVLTVAHVHHGLRGAEADGDAQFVAALADQFHLPFHLRREDTATTARDHRQGLEEAGRHLRYSWFRELLAQDRVNAVLTAHTLDDQAETVLHRVLRGAWTEGLGGIHPVIACAGGTIVRPFLDTRRAAITVWLTEISQPWREDASNQDLRITRNRIRHELLPQLSKYNPRIVEQLARVAAIARDEEAWWDAELRKLLPSLLLPGRPVRGGGRAVSTHPDECSIGMEIERLLGLAPAVRRRILSAAAQQVNCDLNFEQTGRLMDLCRPDAPRKQQVSDEVRAERTARELRLVREAPSRGAAGQTATPIELAVPGEAAGLGVRLRAILHGRSDTGAPLVPAKLRSPQPGDRVRVRHSQKAKPLKEIFERRNIEASARRGWPVLEWEGRIVWMRGVDVDPGISLPFEIEILSEDVRS